MRQSKKPVRQDCIRKRTWTNQQGTEQVRYDAQIYLGRDPETKKQHFLTRTFPKADEARDWVVKRKAAKLNGDVVPNTKETFLEYLDGWLSQHEVRAVTIHGYRSMVDRWVRHPPKDCPQLGPIRLTALHGPAFTQLYRHMKKRGLDRSMRYLHAILKQALEYAVSHDMLNRNPARKANVPKKNPQGEPEPLANERSSKGAMTLEEAGRFRDAAQEDRLGALWWVLLTGGLRPCEALALKWRDIDFEAGAVHVRHTLTRAGLDATDHPEGWKLTLPKTEKSRRTTPLPAGTMKELRKWKARQAQERLQVGAEWQDHGFVFTTQLGSPLDLSNLHRGSFRSVMERAGLGTHGPERKKPRSGPTPKRRFTPSFRIYDLRHTFASLLLDDGEDLVVVSRLLGHATIKLTSDTYIHITEKRKGKATQRWDRLLEARG